ncbi:MAG: hypothetical protein M9944_07845 [Rhizobiaceae bacterium]|nr:hypothetical protein [Rhizobiaceae bacterium]
MITFAQEAPKKADPAIVEMMADTMREMAMNGTAVTADSLFEHSGFTRDQIAAHAAEAADLARATAIRRVA